MAPIPIYTQSPVSAAKVAGVTPKTADSPNRGSTPREQEATTATAPPPTRTSPYPAPQPVARPAPTPTTTHTTTVHSRYAPAPAPTGTAPGGGISPPPSQPGAVPTPPSGTSLPPPPKAGESKIPDSSRGSRAGAESHPTTMPPQMAIPPPTAHQVPSGTAAAMPAETRLTGLFESGAGTTHGHDLQGYQQEMSQPQGFTPAGSASYPQPSGQGRGQGVLAATGEDEGVWEAAKKWAQAAGGSIAAAEDEVWRRINKG